MAQYQDHSTHAHSQPGHTPPPAEGRSGASMAFIVGGLVVAVAIIAWFLFGADYDSVTTTPVEGGDAAVTVETAPAPADDPAPIADPAPEAGAPAGDDPAATE